MSRPWISALRLAFALTALFAGPEFQLVYAAGGDCTHPVSAVGAQAAACAKGKHGVQIPPSESAEDLGIRVIRSTPLPSTDGPVRIDAGRAVFSHMQETGQGLDITSVNIADGRVSKLAEGIREGHFVAENESYLVYTTEGSNARPLVVVDKRSHKRTAKVRLQSEISWGHIAGNHLLIAQNFSNNQAVLLVYRFPALKFERSVDINGHEDIALWGNKVVILGHHQLGIYDTELQEIATVPMPTPEPASRCAGDPLLRISGQQALVVTNCTQVAVVDLPSAHIEQTVPMANPLRSVSMANGLLFTEEANASDEPNDMRVIELSSGRELARLGIDTDFFAMEGRSLLAMERRFKAGARLTLYEVDFEAIRSESSRNARVLRGCRAAGVALEREGDLPAALAACERAGIGGYLQGTELAPPLREAVETYARWLTASLSRYAEAAVILERLQQQVPSADKQALLDIARRKMLFLDPPANEPEPSAVPDPQGVTRVSIDLRASANQIQFDGERIYIGRSDCDNSETPGLVLDVLDRRTFQRLKRVHILACDGEQQDEVTTIAAVPGYVVIGLGYRYEEAGRPTVAVVDALSLERVKTSFVRQDISGLTRWSDRLLACARAIDQPHLRFDAESARYVVASEEEALACANGDSAAFARDLHTPARDSEPETQTPHYRVFPDEVPPHGYRLVHKISGATQEGKPPARKRYFNVLGLPDRDAMVMQYLSGEAVQFSYFDIEAQTNTPLFELRSYGAVSIWDRFLFVSRGSDLLVYDLRRRRVVGYEKNLIREADKNNGGIHLLMQDEGRLMALTYTGANSRVIDLPAYTAGLSTDDFFLSGGGRGASAVAKAQAAP